MIPILEKYDMNTLAVTMENIFDKYIDTRLDEKLDAYGQALYDALRIMINLEHNRHDPDVAEEIIREYNVADALDAVSDRVEHYFRTDYRYEEAYDGEMDKEFNEHLIYFYGHGEHQRQIVRLLQEIKDYQKDRTD